MNRFLHRVLRVGSLLVLPLAGAAAQPSVTETAGFQAIVLTPIGALPVVVNGASPDSTRRFVALVRYGRYRFESGSALFHNVGASVGMMVSRRLQAGATVASRTCGGCEGLRMASLDAAFKAWYQEADDLDGGDASLTLQVTAGWGKPNESSFTATSAAATLPMVVSLPQTWGGALEVFFAPAVAYGRITDHQGAVLPFGGIAASTRAVLSAGSSLRFAEGIAAHFAVHRVVIDDSPTQVGFGVSWSFGKVHGQQP